MIRRELLLAAALLLPVGAAGCRLAPQFTHPDMDVRGAWRDGAPEMESLANVQWFDLYQDDILRELIHEAILSNPDLAVAIARIDEARALAKAVGADIYPRVDLSASAGRSRTTESGASGGSRTSSNYALSFDLAWELDLFGRIRSETDAARANYFRSVEAHRDVGIRLVSEVARAYFELRDLDTQLAITERTVGSNKDYVDLAKLRFEGGKTSEVDFRQSESEYYRAEVVRVDVLRQITVKENEISVLLGHSPGPILRGRSAEEQPLPPVVPAGIPSDLLKRRPDVRVAEEQLVAETALVGARRADLYPRIALTGSYGWESDQLSDLFTSPANTASLIGQLLQPIFNAGRNRALVEAQCARMRAAMQLYRTSVLVAFREVEDGLVSYRRFGEQRGVSEKRVASLRKVLDLAETRYRGGVTEYLEVLDAQRQLFDAELEHATSVRDHLVSLTALYKALGGGWYCGSCVDAPPGEGPYVPPPPPAPPAPPAPPTR